MGLYSNSLTDWKSVDSVRLARQKNMFRGAPKQMMAMTSNNFPKPET
jgi:hypothetical protein